MKNIVLLIFLVVIPQIVKAEPAPFGMEIGKATVEEVKGKYPARFGEAEVCGGGESYFLDMAPAKFEGLRVAKVVFNERGRLVSLMAELPKRKFDDLFQGLEEKYRVVNKSLPFVGDKLALFGEGNTDILLSAPHLSFEMTMIYIDKDFRKMCRSESSEKKKHKKKREASQL